MADEPSGGRLSRAARKPTTPNEGRLIAARIDRLPATATTWKLVTLISLGGFFEFYELFSTAYVVPGMVRGGILKQTTVSFFGLDGIAGYIAATFCGLFIGTFLVGFIADRYGRRTIFTYSLLWYSACAALMALQTDFHWLNFWRFMTGIGLGVELVTIDAYISELVPPRVRGRAFALNQVITYAAVPAVAFIARDLVPVAPCGFDGWRWVMVIGAVGSIVVWIIRFGLPESPRWLAEQGRIEDAVRVVDELERYAIRDTGRQLGPPVVGPPAASESGSIRELWSERFAKRTVMLVIFHAAQAIGLYGFSNWVPTFMIHRGDTLADSLHNASLMTLLTPLGPLLAIAFVDKLERKWQIVASALAVAVAGSLMINAQGLTPIVFSGAMVSIGSTVLSLNFHAYQAELYPTRIRTLAVGVVYSASRISGIFSGFLISYALKAGGVSAAYGLITGCMILAAAAVALLGPRTRGKSLEAIGEARDEMERFDPAYGEALTFAPVPEPGE